eukprot:1007380-Prymnesium_polylepis.2
MLAHQHHVRQGVHFFFTGLVEKCTDLLQSVDVNPVIHELRCVQHVLFPQRRRGRERLELALRRVIARERVKIFF